MKKINKLKYIIFAFICLFIVSNSDVKASSDKYVCYYNTVTFSKVSVPLYVQLTYENGKVDISYFNIVSQKVSKDFGYKNHDYPFKIKSESGKNISATDFINGCPNYLYADAYNDGYVYDIYKGASLNDWEVAYTQDGGCVGVGLYGEVKYCGNLLTHLYYPNHTQTPKKASTSIKYCSYAMDYEASIGNVSAMINLSYDVNNNIFEFTTTPFLGSEGKVSTEFTLNNLKSYPNCPKKIFSKDLYYNKFALSGPVDQTKLSFSLIETYSFKPIEEEMTGCERLGGLNNYIKMIYNLLRFSIPLIIIVLSAISFLSVVFSGEDEKMEKAKKAFIIRLIVGFIILLVPSVLELVLKEAGIIESNNSLTDVVCNIIS